MKSLSTTALELKKTTTAVRVQFSRLNNSKSLKSHEKELAAKQFGASKKRLSASWKLFDIKHQAIARVKNIIGQVKAYWECSTLPYTEESTRLLHRHKIQDFEEEMKNWNAELTEAKNFLDECRDEILQQAKDELGSAYEPDIYPPVLSEEIGFTWDFPSIEPPEYLSQLVPNVYKQEQERIQARLQEAVTLAETAFLNEFKEMVQHLKEKLTPDQDGKKKIFRDSAVTNLSEFFKRFKEMNLGSNDDLDSLVNEANELITGINPEELRDHNLLRAQIAEGLKKIDDGLTPMVTTQKRRKLILPKEPVHETASNHAVPA